MLKWQVNIHKSCDSLHRATLLGMVDEVALAGLVFGIPFKAIVASR